MADKVENDLYKLKGIGPKRTAMLESIGVDSIKELRHRVPANLLEMITTRHGSPPGMGLRAVTNWINQAKAWKD
jgi:predicted flap endonuclease-1-like 5' DNA nuclease